MFDIYFQLAKLYSYVFYLDAYVVSTSFLRFLFLYF